MSSFFFFNDTATTEIYTLSLHDALPIYAPRRGLPVRRPVDAPDDRCRGATPPRGGGQDRATAPRGRLVRHRFVDLSDRHGRLLRDPDPLAAAGAGETGRPGAAGGAPASAETALRFPR